MHAASLPLKEDNFEKVWQSAPVSDNVLEAIYTLTHKLYTMVEKIPTDEEDFLTHIVLASELESFLFQWWMQVTNLKLINSDIMMTKLLNLYNRFFRATQAPHPTHIAHNKVQTVKISIIVSAKEKGKQKAKMPSSTPPSSKSMTRANQKMNITNL